MQKNAIIFTIPELASINAMQVKAVQLSQSNSFKNCPASFWTMNIMQSETENKAELSAPGKDPS